MWVHNCTSQKATVAVQLTKKKVCFLCYLVDDMMRIRIASRIIKDKAMSRWDNWIMIVNPTSSLADELNVSKGDISEVLLFSF
jgi:RNA polymerase subunit RPABC4/transcription elongation factor Spt4